MSSKERRSLSGSVHGCSLSGSTHGSSLSGSVALGRTLRRESSIDGKALAEAIKWSGMQPLFAGRFTDGTLMAKLASEHCDTFRKLLSEKRECFPPRELTIGSACSGTAGEVVAAHFFEKAVNAVSDRGFRIKTLFACESEAKKRAWIEGVHQWKANMDLASGHVETTLPCNFLDVSEIGDASGMARCATHKQKCRVPHCNIFVCCTSCKDMSRMSPPCGKILAETTSTGGSADTFKGMLAYIDVARPAILVFENVESIGDADASGGGSNLDIVLAELSSRGYENQQMIGDSAQYGVPQSRKRCYIIGVLAIANSEFDFLERSTENTFQSLRSLITVGQRTPPCAAQVLYAGSDKRVLDRLRQLQSQPLNCRKKCYAAGSAVISSAANGVSWSAIESPEIMKLNPWFLTLSPLQYKVCAYSLRTDPTPALFRDISQSLQRTRSSIKTIYDRHLSFTVTPKQVVVVFKDDEAPRLLLGEEMLLLHGFPVSAVSDLVNRTENQVLADLAGNMVSSLIMLILLMSSVACVEWSDVDRIPRCAEEATASEDIETATYALGLLAKTGDDEDGPLRKRNRI